MKEFIKKWLIIYGLAAIAATVIPAFVNQYWVNAIFTVRLLFTLLLICLLQLLTERIAWRFFLVKHAIDLSITLIVVLALGRIWKWYELPYAWMMFAMVIPVYIGAYFLGLFRMRKDVEVINQRIRRRQDKLKQRRTETEEPEIQIKNT